MLTITSRENQLVKHIVKLCSSRKYRRETAQFVTEGEKLCAEALASLGQPQSILLTENALQKHGSKLAEISEVHPDAYLITEDISGKMSTAQSSQGVFCVWELPVQRDTSQIQEGKYLLLCSLQDPGNMGTIIRSCEAFGISGIVLSEDCPDIYSPKVLRATMGGVFRLPVYTSECMTDTIDALKEQGFKVYATALSLDSVSITEADFSGSSAVAIGNEGAGLPDGIIERCSSTVIIPMKGNAESLNAAMAAGIIAWEMTK